MLALAMVQTGVFPELSAESQKQLAAALVTEFPQDHYARMAKQMRMRKRDRSSASRTVAWCKAARDRN